MADIRNASAPSGACPLRFDIGGMHCAACSSRIERVVGRMPEVDRVSVNLATARAEVWPAAGDAEAVRHEVMAAVAKLGFTATPAATEDAGARFAASKARAQADRRRRLRRLWPMLAFSVPLLIVSMGHMLGLPLPAWLEPHGSPRAFMLVQLGLTLPVVWLGRHFYVDGLAALARRSPNMDSLVAVGTGAAFLYSLVNTVLGLAGNDPAWRAM
ncbi:cation transporter, partial [uncultured Desulfovibrio sp.]